MNDKNKLGLPIEYQQMPEYFDAHNVNEHTEAKNALIAKLLREQGVKSVLDMTCGTGSQVFYLTSQGYEVIGNDFSPALVEIARAKAKKMNLDLTFIDGDMREVQVGKFDAVGQYDMDGKDFVAEKSLNILTVARMKKINNR